MLILLLKPADAAEALAVSERTLFTLTKAGKVPCVRLGRSVRYSVTDLEDWIAGQTQGRLDQTPREATLDGKPAKEGR
jgi:excisionase family DNA binding protein